MRATSTIASLGLTMVTSAVKRRQSGDRVTRHFSPEIFRPECQHGIWHGRQHGDGREWPGHIRLCGVLGQPCRTMPSRQQGRACILHIIPKRDQCISGMPYNPITRGRQTGCRQSDDCIVLRKAGNAAGGKAVMQSHIRRET